MEESFQFNFFQPAVAATSTTTTTTTSINSQQQAAVAEPLAAAEISTLDAVQV